ARVCFFFQAEDGIRDFHVTGVQTCAFRSLDSVELVDAVALGDLGGRHPAAGRELVVAVDAEPAEGGRDAPADAGLARAHEAEHEIGRASCREREESWGVAVAVGRRVRGWW